MTERVEGARTDVPRVVPEHASWCTAHTGDACSSETFNVPGVNVGTYLGLWISDEDLGRGIIPIPAYLGLTGYGDRPATDIFFDAKGLRALATAAAKLADALDGEG